MFCTNCKKAVKDGAKFCPYCGNSMFAENYTTHSETAIDKESNTALRQIVIAAVGEPSDVHTLLVDEKYPSHLKSGELLRIPVSEDAHKLTWKSPSLFSLSEMVPSQ